MSRVVHEVQGYALVLDKVVHVTRVFEARDEEGAQFNIRCVGNSRLTLKFPTQAEVTLQRELLIKALRES